jgi:hypothetical protein
MTKHENCDCLGCQGFDLDKELAKVMELNGWVGVFVSESDFCYTMGLTESLVHPEIIVTGPLSADQFNSLLADAVDRIKAGQPLAGEQELLGLRCAVRGVSETNRRDLMCKAWKRYEGEFQAVQLVVPDAEGRLPWEAECNPDWRGTQRDLQ